MNKLTVITIVACLAMVGGAQAACETIDFEGIPTGTSVIGPYAISPLLSIEGQQMEVVEEALANGSILCYNCNLNGIPNNQNGGQNWLPGANAKSFGNPSTLRGLDSQDLTITFDPSIFVSSFAIEFFDYGDWFPSQGNTGTGTPTLKAFDVADNELDSSSVSVTYGSDNDVWDLWNDTGNGAISLTVTGSDIAYVTLVFDRMDPGMTFDNIEICYTSRVECDSATGDGTRIRDKGSWFMYNTYPDGPYDIQAGNPDDGIKIIGSYDVAKDGDMYTVTYAMDATIEMNGYIYDIVVVDEHLAISDAPDFMGKPGRDDNQDFGTAFYDADGDFYIFAHFAVEYQAKSVAP